ncbi:hypothetical protein ES703_54350 [subsurface metagenome]
MPQKLKQMREIVLRELEHIPNWPEPQGELRMVYWNRRMHSLGRKVNRQKTAKEVLEESIASLRGDYPGFKFEYDEQFFNKDEE